MNQSELVDKVAQKTTLTQAAATEAVKAVVQAVLESLVAGEPVRVSGLGTFNVAARPARDGRNPQTGESIKIPASKAVRFHAGKTVKDALNPPRSVGNKKSARPKRSVAQRCLLPSQSPPTASARSSSRAAPTGWGCSTSMGRRSATPRSTGRITTWPPA